MFQATHVRRVPMGLLMMQVTMHRLQTPAVTILMNAKMATMAVVMPMQRVQMRQTRAIQQNVIVSSVTLVTARLAPSLPHAFQVNT